MHFLIFDQSGVVVVPVDDAVTSFWNFDNAGLVKFGLEAGDGLEGVIGVVNGCCQRLLRLNSRSLGDMVGVHFCSFLSLSTQGDVVGQSGC